MKLQYNLCIKEYLALRCNATALQALSRTSLAPIPHSRGLPKPKHFGSEHRIILASSQHVLPCTQHDFDDAPFDSFFLLANSGILFPQRLGQEVVFILRVLVETRWERLGNDKRSN